MQRSPAAATGAGAVVDLMEAVVGLTAVGAEVTTAAGVEVSVVVADSVAIVAEDIVEAVLLAARGLSEPGVVTGAEVSEADQPPAVMEPVEVHTEVSAHRAV
jgi:hypothetical protein